MGERKVLSEAELKELVMPEEGKLLGRVVKLWGGDHVLIRCVDGRQRLVGVRGRLKRRIWLREGDVVLVAPWDFRSGERFDVLWRHTIAQVDFLRDDGYLSTDLYFFE